eukprot:scaffold52568_cov60-Phaeocystis_antarctica.AAC.3
MAAPSSGASAAVKMTMRLRRSRRQQRWRRQAAECAVATSRRRIHRWIEIAVWKAGIAAKCSSACVATVRLALL